MSKTSVWTILALLTALVGGCAGYTTEGLHRADVHTVAVPVFESREFRRGLEYEMTKELVNMIELRTPYKVATRERADTVIDGTIEDLAESIVAEDDRDVSTAVQVTLQVSYQWTDLRTGEVLRSGTPQYAWHYAPSEDQTLRSAQTTAIRRLAERIVEDMEKDW